jgi:CDP-4-dehydro-6-deoxyglucose reductase
MDLAVLVDIIKETDKNWRFIFESPLYDKINFTAGQLVQLVAKPYGPSEGVDSIQRNYSVASWPSNTNKFELIITYLQDGKMSEYLFNEARIGDEFAYKGPMGIFTLPQDLTQRDIFMVSTGSGISPFRSMMGYIHENNIPFKNIKLFFGTRTQDDLLYKNELQELHKKYYPNFEYIPVLSREKWVRHTGYVHEHYLGLIDKMEEKPLVYFCGWDRMISEGRQHLSNRGFEMMKDIRVEIFG